MSKRGVESELDEMSDEILTDLDPDERLQLAITEIAQGKDDRVKRLHETCPRKEYRQPEMSYMGRIHLVFQLATQAVYDLHKMDLVYELIRTRNEYRIRLWAVTGSETTAEQSSEDESEGGKDDDAGMGHSNGATAEDDSEPELSLTEVLGELYVQYLAYEQFAEEVLGVALDEWLALHPDGRTIVQESAEILANNKRELDWAEAELNDAPMLAGTTETSNDSEWVSLDDVAEQMFCQLQEKWEDAVDSF